MSKEQPTFWTVLGVDLPNIGDSQEVFGEKYKFWIERTINGELIVIRRTVHDSDIVPWKIEELKFREIMSRVEGHSLCIETHSYVSRPGLLFSFAIKSSVMQVYLRRSDLYFHIQEGESLDVAAIIKFLDEIFMK